MTDEEFNNLKAGDVLVRTFDNYQSRIGYEARVFIDRAGVPCIHHELQSGESWVVRDRWDLVKDHRKSSRTSGFGNFVKEKGI